MARHEAQRKYQKFSDLKYILLGLLCILSCTIFTSEGASLPLNPLITIT